MKTVVHFVATVSKTKNLPRAIKRLHSKILNGKSVKNKAKFGDKRNYVE